MFAVKIIVGIACVYCSVKISSNKANLLKNRYLFWDSLVEFCSLLLQELSYKKRPIKEVTSNEFISIDFSKTLNDYYLKNEITLPNYLSDIESEKVISFLSSIGKSDTESQKIAINTCKIDFENIATQRKLDYKKSYSVILKVGFSIGVMLFIMVI